jgi:hypothetical protein
MALCKATTTEDDTVHSALRCCLDVIGYRKEGHASDMVLTQLKFAASAPLLQELVGIRKDLEVRACSQYKYSSNVKKSLQSSLRI